MRVRHGCRWESTRCCRDASRWSAGVRVARATNDEKRKRCGECAQCEPTRKHRAQYDSRRAVPVLTDGGLGDPLLIVMHAHAVAPVHAPAIAPVHACVFVRRSAQCLYSARSVSLSDLDAV
jgi:hypothetical protein